VLKANDDEIQLTFLHSSGRQYILYVPSLPAILWVSVSEVLAEVDQQLQWVTHILSMKRNLVASLRN
jgi:hypothetical protein